MNKNLSALITLAIGNFLVGTGILAPAGMIAEIAESFAVSLSTAGSLLWVGSISVAITAPVLAWATSRLDRKLVLVSALISLGLGYFLSILAPSFGFLLVARVLAGAACGVFTPQAAAVAGSLVPPERRTQAVAFVLLGWSLAAAAGLPLAKLLAAHFGWQVAMGAIAASAAASALALHLTTRPGMTGGSATLATWGLILRHGPMMATLLITLLIMTSQYLLLTYMVPVIEHGLGADAGRTATILAICGIAGVAGAIASARWGWRIGLGPGVMLAVGLMAIGMAVWAGWVASLLAVILGAILWGLGNFAATGLQQARLIALEPGYASASVALNSSMIYLGGAIGSYLGGLVLDHDVALVPAAAALAMALGLALAVVMVRSPGGEK